MKKKEKLNHKKKFTKLLKDFVEGLTNEVSTADGQWKIKGFIDTLKNVYMISDDTKVISKILEIHLFPLINEFANNNGFRIILPDHQNYYPDMTFECIEDKRIKFAVDIKTSYRSSKNPNHINGFTLGSHGTYFMDRSSTKNIQFPYSTYIAHFCIGVIYSRTNISNEEKEGIYTVAELGPVPKEHEKLYMKTLKIDELRSIASVLTDFTFFACEKWQIASDMQGSHNTANIGSITCIDDLLSCNGVFSKLGESWFDEYWFNYGTIRDKNSTIIKNLKDYVKFKGGDVSKVVPRKTRGGKLI